MRKHGLIGIIFCMVFLTSISAKAEPLLYLPFEYGEWWYCTQGQGGSYSHQGNLYYGFDFNQGSNSNSSSNPAYGGNLYSPTSGEIVEIRDGLQDFHNNSSSNAQNHWGWGNTIVIEDEASVYYIRLAHLRYGSTDHLQIGDFVEVGDYIGQVGQTGYSTSPHLHIQVMRSSMGPSEPFSFVEGNLYSYEWIQSRLVMNTSVMDNTGQANLGHDFGFGYTLNYGGWQVIKNYEDYAGENYRRHFVLNSYDFSYFRWRFKVKTSGYYLIYTTFPVDEDNDPQARYYFEGNFVRYMNQTQGTSFYRYLVFKYLSANKIYTIKVRGKTANRYVVADAIVLRRI